MICQADVRLYPGARWRSGAARSRGSKWTSRNWTPQRSSENRQGTYRFETRTRYGGCGRCTLSR